MTSTIDTPPPPHAPAPEPRSRVLVRRLPTLDELPAPAATQPEATQPEAAPPAATQPEAAPPGAALPPITSAAQGRSPHGQGSLTELTSVLRMMLEVLDGRRPPAQLANRVTPSVRRYVTAAVGRLDRAVPGRPAVRPARCGPPGLRSVRACRPADGVREVSAGWHYRGRHRALAARFEWRAGRWTCTALRLG